MSATEEKPLLPPDATPEGPPSNSQEKKGDTGKRTIHIQEIGVWTTIREVSSSWVIPGYSIVDGFKDLVALFPFVRRFFGECFDVGPWLVTIYFLSSLWESTESAVDLYFSSQLLDIIQQSILHQQVKKEALVVAVVSRLAFTFVNSVIRRTRRKTKPILANRVRYLFEGRLLQANLRLDLPTFEEPETATKINRLIPSHDRGGAWEILENLFQKFLVLTSVLSQVGFLFKVLRSQPGSMWFAVLCLAKSMLDYTTYDSWWRNPSYTWASNPHYQRLSSLKHIGVDAAHRIEIVSNVLSDYIQREWNKAREFLRDVSDDHPSSVIRTQKSFMVIFLDSALDDFPLIFYAYQVALSPGSFSLTSVALMQQASASLAWTISSVATGQNTLAERFNDIKALYETSHIPNNLQDEGLQYPHKENEPSPGMEITFRNVSFAYPNAENVLKNVSFTIRSGQTVIIVGVNGSGKSTLLKLFNRLYDTSSGTVLIDGVPIQSFCATDVRRASAMLFQKYNHFSLPIRENISMGLPDTELPPANTEKGESTGPVLEAARLGGAVEFVTAQTDGFDTILRPDVSGWSTNTRQNMGPMLQKKLKEIQKKADVSQGQWQRLALSRLFFRAAGEGTKLVAVDEPSASLDPEMEYELFERLKELSTKKGKTMVFVTHRFGHLTKQADLILVMQKGCLVEQGKHKDLMEMGGAYAKLYKKQADAFFPDDGHQ